MDRCVSRWTRATENGRFGVYIALWGGGVALSSRATAACAQIGDGENHLGSGTAAHVGRISLHVQVMCDLAHSNLVRLAFPILLLLATGCDVHSLEHVEVALDRGGRLHVLTRRVRITGELDDVKNDGFVYLVREDGAWSSEEVIEGDDGFLATSPSETLYELLVTNDGRAIAFVERAAGLSSTAFDNPLTVLERGPTGNWSQIAVDPEMPRDALWALAAQSGSFAGAWLLPDGAPRFLVGNWAFEVRDSRVTNAVDTGRSCAGPCLFAPHGNGGLSYAYWGWGEPESLWQLGCVGSSTCAWEEIRPSGLAAAIDAFDLEHSWNANHFLVTEMGTPASLMRRSSERLCARWSSPSPTSRQRPCRVCAPTFRAATRSMPCPPSAAEAKRLPLLPS